MNSLLLFVALFPVAALGLGRQSDPSTDNNYLLWEEDYDYVVENEANPPPHDQVARMARYIVHNSS